MAPKNKIAIFISAAVLLALFGYWFFNRERLQFAPPGEIGAPPPIPILTEEEKMEMLESLAPVTEELTEKQKLDILKGLSVPPAAKDLTREERLKILESLNAPQ